MPSLLQRIKSSTPKAEKSVARGIAASIFSVQGLKRNWRRHLTTVLEVAKELSGCMPAAGDTKLQRVMKVGAAASVLNKSLWPESDDEFEDHALTHDLVRHDSEPFVALFFGTDLHKSFEITRFPCSNDCCVLYDAKSKYGRLAFNGCSVARTSGGFLDRFWMSRDTDLSVLIDALWSSYDGLIYMSTNGGGQLLGNRVDFARMPVAVASLFGRSGDRVRSIIDRHRKFASIGRQRSYMFYGKPGTGKTQAALHFASEVGARALKIDASTFSFVDTKTLLSTIVTLAPDFIIVDDCDKVVLGNSVPAMLELMQRLSASGITVIMTANEIGGFDPGLLRPGRVNEWVEFELPDFEERRLVLVGHLEAAHAHMTAPDVQSILEASDGLSHDYMRELANEYTVLGVESATALAKCMTKHLAAVGDGGTDL